MNYRITTLKSFVLFYWAIVLFSAVTDLFFIDDISSVQDVATTAVLALSASLVPFSPRLLGWAFVVIDAVLVGASSFSVGVVGYICIVVVFLWGLNNQKIDAVAGSLILVGGFWLANPDLPAAVIMLTLLLTAGAVAGFQIRRYLEERDAAQTQLWQRERQQMEEAQQFRDGLAMQLHDSLAGTLSVAATLSETLHRELLGNSELAGKAELLNDQVRSSLQELRGIIQLLDAPRSPSSEEADLASQLARVKSAAAGVGVTLELQYEPAALDRLPVATASVLSAFIREVATNLVKFAAPASEAEHHYFSRRGYRRNHGTEQLRRRNSRSSP